MAVVQGIREQIHGPVYDALKVPPGKQLREVEPTSTLRFFVNVQNKTKLETNLQSAALLPHYNTFEARAMRVVISDLPPLGSEEVTVEVDATKIEGSPGSEKRTEVILKTDLRRAMELLEEARADTAGKTSVAATETPPAGSGIYTEQDSGDELELTAVALEDAINAIERRKSPPRVQLRPNNGAGTIISKFIYNTVTTLYVGEKIMIQMPTWFFPAGAGPYSETARMTTNGLPSPQDTFRFAEPIFIDRQQNFRVEVEIPDADVLKDLQRIYGPFFMWVVLDGYMTRGVQ